MASPNSYPFGHGLSQGPFSCLALAINTTYPITVPVMLKAAQVYRPPSSANMSKSHTIVSPLFRLRLREPRLGASKKEQNPGLSVLNKKKIRKRPSPFTHPPPDSCMSRLSWTHYYQNPVGRGRWFATDSHVRLGSLSESLRAWSPCRFSDLQTDLVNSPPSVERSMLYPVPAGPVRLLHQAGVYCTVLDLLNLRSARP